MMKFILLIFASLSFMAGYFYETTRTLQLAGELREAKEENQKLKDRIDALQKQVAPPTQSKPEALAAPNPSDLSGRITSKQKELNDLRDQLNDAEEEHARSSAPDTDPRSIQRQKESLQSAQEALSSLENQKKSYLADTKNQNSEMKKKTLAYDKSQIEALKQAIINQNEIIAITHADIESTKKKRPIDKAALEQLNEQQEQQKLDLAQMKSNRGLWEKSQQQVKTLPSGAEPQNDDLDGQINAARANVALLKKQILDANQALQESKNYDQKIASLKNAIQAKQKELELLQ